MERLLVGGIVSLTTVDYPGHLASVVFLQGCPWRCVYCHNPHLQAMLPVESLPWEDVLALIEMRREFVEAVIFSGGEPLAQGEVLSSAINDVKNLGYKVGLHTTGAYPDRFSKLLHVLDWVGFDVKHSFRDYEQITNVQGSGNVALESLKILIASNVDFEARMTLYDRIPSDAVVDTLKDIALMGVKTVALQKCRDKNENVVEHPIFSDKLLLENLSKYFDNFYIRG
ncbi:MAG: anaerobic ribonucleoside-triphosphate reductase activating protein [Alphaproteobacteria bacterium]|nr:anaerobic ribonucleoside-triphosphate reductase activating protein [Alphaproteobacteria bacterium]